MKHATLATASAAIAIAAGAMISPAGPASAATGFTGLYNYRAWTKAQPAESATLSVFPCGPDCRKLTDAEGGTSYRAYLRDGKWEFSQRWNKLKCRDGSTTAAVATFRISATTLRGKKTFEPVRSSCALVTRPVYVALTPILPL